MKRLLVLLTLAYQMGWGQGMNSFVPNMGQFAPDIRYLARVPGGAVQIRNNHWLVQQLDTRKLEQLHHRHAHRERGSNFTPEWVNGNNVRVEFVGGQLGNAHPIGATGSYHNYFTHPDPECWVTNVSTYRGVRFTDVYAGIDLQVYEHDQSIKYDWHLAPGADPTCIRVAYSGMAQLQLAEGRLVVQHELGGWQEQEPIAYQFMEGVRKPVACRFHIRESELTFTFPDGYDECETLVIDPLLIFSTYTGFTADNWASTATPGERGKAYSAGATNQLTFGGVFPATPGSFQASYGGLYDVGIVKFDSLGTQLLYASFLGGSLSESAHSLVMDANNDLVVLGTTSSANFPTTATAYDRSYNGGKEEANVIEYAAGSDIFVARISSDGRVLKDCTLLGGSGNDGMNPTTSILVANYGDELRGDIVTDGDGNILISSVTDSRDMPIFSGFQNTYRGGDSDAYVAKLSPDLSFVIWSTYLGGILADASHTIKISTNNTVLLGGGSASPNFPITAGAYQTGLAGEADGWVARLSADGDSVLAATFTGTRRFDQVYFVDQDRAGAVFAYGQSSDAMPVTPGAYNNPRSGQFLQKFSSDLKTLQLATVFGSGRTLPDISPTAFLVNDCDKIYMSGWGGAVNFLPNYWGTNTRNMPVSPDALQKNTNGSDFYFIVLTSDFREMLYATYLGGGQSATHVDGGTSRFDKSGIVYHAVCAGCRAANTTGMPTSDFPTTPGAFSRLNRSGNCNNAVFKFDLSSLRARIQTNSITLRQPGLSRICLPDEVVFQNLSSGGRIYEWNLGDGTRLVRPDTSLVRHRYANPGRYVVKLKAIDQGTCVGADSTVAVIDAFRATAKAAADVAVCAGAEVLLNASGGVLYKWENDQNKTVLTGSTQRIVPDKSITYRVTITEASGCTKIDTLEVKVVPGIDLKWEWDRIFSCTDLPRLAIKRLTEPKEDEFIFFDLGDGTTLDAPEAQHTFARAGRYDVKLVGRKEFCVYENTQRIEIFPFTVPNVITPQVADGKNDRLQLLFGSSSVSDTGLQASIKIFNRWGNLVYQSANYQNDWSGENVAAGVYFLEFRSDTSLVCKTWLHVVK
jgi:hypothetical protein